MKKLVNFLTLAWLSHQLADLRHADAVWVARPHPADQDQSNQAKVVPGLRNDLVFMATHSMGGRKVEVEGKKAWATAVQTFEEERQNGEFCGFEAGPTFEWESGKSNTRLVATPVPGSDLYEVELFPVEGLEYKSGYQVLFERLVELNLDGRWKRD